MTNHNNNDNEKISCNNNNFNNDKNTDDNLSTIVQERVDYRKRNADVNDELALNNKSMKRITRSSTNVTQSKKRKVTK